jgi:hypothetical protein
MNNVAPKVAGALSSWSGGTEALVDALRFLSLVVEAQQIRLKELEHQIADIVAYQDTPRRRPKGKGKQ